MVREVHNSRKIVIGRLKLPMELWTIFRPQDFMPKGQFYALAIFVMGRLDTKGVGIKLWGRRRVCSQDYPIALSPLLLREHKHDHDFLFSFPFENAKAIMAA